MADTTVRPTFLHTRSDRAAIPLDELQTERRDIVVELTHDSETTSNPVSSREWAPITAKESESSIPV